MDAVQSIKPRSAVPPRNQALREAAAVPDAAAERHPKSVDPAASAAGREDRRRSPREFLIEAASHRALLAGDRDDEAAEQALLRRRAYRNARGGGKPEPGADVQV
jgi:hypothetical protein